MKRFSGGSEVRGGHYWNLRQWEICPVAGASGVLPGEERDSYVRLAVPVVVLVAPVMAALHVGFLPAAGFYVLFEKLAQWVGGRAAAADEAAASDSTDSSP